MKVDDSLGTALNVVVGNVVLSVVDKVVDTVVVFGVNKVFCVVDPGAGFGTNIGGLLRRGTRFLGGNLVSFFCGNLGFAGIGAVNESNSSKTSFLGTVFNVDSVGLIVVVLDSVVVDVVVELLLMGSVSFLSEGLYSET